MITGKTLYDSNGQQFYPYSDAEYIYSGVIGSNMLKADLIDINNKADQALLQSSGAQAVSGSLQVDVYYKNSTESNETNIISEGDTGWEATMTPPNSSAPYCWKRTRYYWKISESESPQVIKTIYEICATALYPETQVMYTAITGVPKKPLEGPKDYGDSSNDQNNDGETIWKNYFEGIDGSKTQGYMATRHRDAGQNWPDDGGWKLALFAQYPTEEIQQPTS